MDERGARRTLRAQIARLERELGETILAAFPHVHDADTVAFEDEGAAFRLAGPLAPAPARGCSASASWSASATTSPSASAAHASSSPSGPSWRPTPAPCWRRCSASRRATRASGCPLADLGERGCGAYHVRPRLGIIGMLMGWWHIKLSSGCPLPAPA